MRPEDPLGDRVLRVRLAVIESRVARDVEVLPLWPGSVGSPGRAVSLPPASRRVAYRPAAVDSASDSGSEALPGSAPFFVDVRRPAPCAKTPREPAPHQHRHEQSCAAVHARGLLAGLAGTSTFSHMVRQSFRGHRRRNPSVSGTIADSEKRLKSNARSDRHGSSSPSKSTC